MEKTTGRAEKEYHGSTYHNWSEASGFGHFPEWLSKEQELRLQDVIDLLVERGYRYYEEVLWIASSIEYVASYAQGEERVVAFGPRKFFLGGVTKQSLLAHLTHTQTYLTRDQADTICSEIQQQFPDWQVKAYHASKDVKSISPRWDEWRVSAMGIYKGRKAWRWTISETGEWSIMCHTMECDHQMLYSQIA
jgi:hypothetical protein